MADTKDKSGDIKDALKLSKQYYMLLMAITLGLFLLFINVFIKFKLEIEELEKNNKNAVEIATLRKELKAANAMRKNHKADFAKALSVESKIEDDKNRLKGQIETAVKFSYIKENLKFSSHNKNDYLRWLSRNANRLNGYYSEHYTLYSADSPRYINFKTWKNRLPDRHPLSRFIRTYHQVMIAGFENRLPNMTKALYAAQVNYVFIRELKKLKKKPKIIATEAPAGVPVSDPTLVIPDYVSRKLREQLQDIIVLIQKQDDIINVKENRINDLEGKQPEGGENKKTKKNFDPEITLSGVKVPVSIMIPYYPVILLVLYLIFLVTLERSYTLFHNARSKRKAKFHFLWLLIYREKLSKILAPISLFIPAIFIIIIVWMSQGIRTPLGAMSESLLSKILNSMTYYFVAIICALLIMGMAFRAHFLRSKIMEDEKLVINPEKTE